jgi:hypothetical protein
MMKGYGRSEREEEKEMLVNVEEREKGDLVDKEDA